MKHKRKDVTRRGIKIAVMTAVVIAAALGGYLFILYQNLPSLEEISGRQIKQSTKIYDRTGTVLLYEISGGQKRTFVSLGDIPSYLKEATIAIEDQNFWNGPAFSLRGIARALWVNLRAGEVRQGGSTITQQLARNAFLSPERTIERKIKELLLAIRLGRYYSKEKILELYLNEVSYGPNIYGVAAASEAYFNKPVKELDLAEAALLAALPKAPSYYSPWGSHFQELLERQKLVLRTMKKLGKISDAELEQALATKIDIRPPRGEIKASHFVFMVQDELLKKYGEEMVRTGGLTVITTLDAELQKFAEEAVREGAERNEKLYDGWNAALVATDPKTGQILALVGSRDPAAKTSLPPGCTPGINCRFEPHFNVAVQGMRQPGSALKPFVYLAALQKGFTPETVIFDVPTEFVSNNPLCPPQPDFSAENTICFHPRNFDNKFRGPVSLRVALGQSINVPAVKVLYLAGLKNSLTVLNDFGVTTLTNPSRYGLSLVLGGGEVRLIELVGAYAVLAQNGVKHNPSLILEVRDAAGRTLEKYSDESKTVVEAKYTSAINDILSDVGVRAGLFGASLGLTIFPGYEVALKTGTTSDYRDAWAIGYTPNLVAGVWAGNNDNSPMRPRGTSILAAVPIWNSFMAKALPKFPPEPFLKTDNLTAAKPILGGSYWLSEQLHTILYYLNKDDPLGPPPINPTADPQFLNWEFGVLSWAKDNLDFLSQLSQSNLSKANSSTPPVVKILSPLAGEFIKSDSLEVKIEVSGAKPISRIAINFNSQRVYESMEEKPANYILSSLIRTESAAPQNLISVEVENKDGAVARAEVIVYK